MRELHVPKRRVEVELSFTGGHRGRYAVFLAEHAPGRAGPERLSDVLARGDFFPTLDPASDEVALVAPSAVALATVPRDAEPGDEDELAAPTEHRVELHLHDGQRARGTVSYVLPPERSRLVDFLNAAPPFLRLLGDAGELVLVNRAHVVRVLPLR